MAASARGRGAGEVLGAGRLLERWWEWQPGGESGGARCRVGRCSRLRGSPFVCTLPKWLRPGRAATAARALPGPRRSVRSRSPGKKTLSGRRGAQRTPRTPRVSSSDLQRPQKQIPDGKAPCWDLTATDPPRIIVTSEETCHSPHRSSTGE
ncbi:rCG38536 [Rattus norvegicus]|uniref:RCG38536 n=1 Tax=Rattus norvegicus TaxID=10116 RepID=A6KMD1_RAT|nr:rCG38536 [Rattus norvegicus]